MVDTAGNNVGKAEVTQLGRAEQGRTTEGAACQTAFLRATRGQMVGGGQDSTNRFPSLLAPLRAARMASMGPRGPSPIGYFIPDQASKGVCERGQEGTGHLLQAK